MEHTVEYAHATGVLSGIWLLVAIPLVSAGILLLLGKRANKWGHWLGVLSVAASFVLGVIFFISLRNLGGNRAVEQSLFDYIMVGRLHVDFGLLFDPLSGVFVLLITGVGSLIHLYAVGYMEHDPGRRRFFGYFNLFIAAMLMLVLGNNYVMLYLGWEGVGLASYLLIAFWFNRPSAATAGKKAFLMNRVGDAGLVLGIFLMFATLGTTKFDEVFNGVGRLSSSTILIMGLLLLLALLMGCIIGAAKDDIKRVLAWSTVSQIGYMFLGVGLGRGAYALALVHLLSHGFFKANMFLGAGSVMHGMDDQVNIRRFGGLWRYMRITWLTFMTGWLAIIGLFPFSGFFSKEPIIAAAFEREDWTGWLFGMAALIGAGLTAFYMTRLFVLTFHGPKRWTEDIHEPHESPPIMTVPLVLLALGSIVAGGLMAGPVPRWLSPVLGRQETPIEPVLQHWAITTLSLVVTVVGVGVAWALFRNGTALEEQPAGVLVTAARRNLYTDTFNEIVFERPGIYLIRALVYLDNKGIDGLVNGIAASVGGSSGRLRRLQTGFVRSYALSMLTGALLVLGAFLAIQLGWFA